MGSALALVLTLLLLLPIAAIAVVYHAARQIRFHWPKLSVTRDGFTIKVTLSIKVENPSWLPLPTLEVLAGAWLNNYVIFKSESTTIGTLDPGQTATISLTTTINMDLFADLFWTLVDYLAGKPISYVVQLLAKAHFLIDFTLASVDLRGTFELY